MLLSVANPPTFVNLAVLVTATHTKYDDSLLALSRALVFFQLRTVFTQEDVDPQSLSDGVPVNDLDRLVEFKLIINLWSPTLEEVNDMWGMLELKFHATERESGLITEVVSGFSTRQRWPRRSTLTSSSS